MAKPSEDKPVKKKAAKKTNRTYKNILFTCPPELKEELDTRAKELGLTRSGYIQLLVRQDLGDSDVKIEPKEPEEKE